MGNHMFLAILNLPAAIDDNAYFRLRNEYYWKGDVMTRSTTEMLAVLTKGGTRW